MNNKKQNVTSANFQAVIISKIKASKQPLTIAQIHQIINAVSGYNKIVILSGYQLAKNLHAKYC